ncbi:hypothetical protein BGZ60DRAFT_423771, partial [Tricladium varicosporioides]
MIVYNTILPLSILLVTASTTANPILPRDTGQCRTSSDCPTWAPCCSTHGYCGSTPDYCGSPDPGQCVDGKCPSGMCCS